MNIADEYLGLSAGRGWFGGAKKTDRGWWRDHAPACGGPRRRCNSSRCSPRIGSSPPGKELGGEFAGGRLFPDPAASGKTAGSAVCQCVPSGPGRPDGERRADGPRGTCRTCFLTAITSARTSIDLTTGYFVPPAGDRPGPSKRRRGGGVRVRLLVPRGSAGSRGRSSPGPQRLRVPAPGRRGDPRVPRRHAARQDPSRSTGPGAWSASANLDARSFYLNFEVGLALYDDPTAERLSARFTADTAKAERIDADAWARRAGVAGAGGELLPDVRGRCFGPGRGTDSRTSSPEGLVPPPPPDTHRSCSIRHAPYPAAALRSWNCWFASRWRCFCSR